MRTFLLAAITALSLSFAVQNVSAAPANGTVVSEAAQAVQTTQVRWHWRRWRHRGWYWRCWGWRCW